MRRRSFKGGVYLKVVRDIFHIKRLELTSFFHFNYFRVAALIREQCFLIEGGAYSSKYATQADITY